MQDKETDIIRVQETDSTNNYIRQILSERDLKEGSIVIADSQTAGRGQAGNFWESEQGKNLTFSIIIYPDFIPANRQFIISQTVALSIQKTLNEYTNGITVKWPNDIYWKEKKICGILIENDLAGISILNSILGIGININQKTFRSNAPNPVSLSQITNVEYNLDEVLQRFRRHFYALYLSLVQGKTKEIRDEYLSVLYRREGFHDYRDNCGDFKAEIKDISLTGQLLLRLPDNTTREYAFKEVAFI